MGFFSKKTDKRAAAADISRILEEHQKNLNAVTVNLSKTTGVDFEGLKSRVKIVLDYSGSMESLYANGTVQQVITQLFPFALKFDDDGELECYLFSNGHKEIDPCNLENYANYVNDVIFKSGFSMGGTKYASVLEDIHKKITADIPDFIIYITDGDNFDKSETDNIIRKMSTDNCFILFVGIGRSDFGYLEKLDNLSGREIDNTGFIRFKDIAAVNDSEMYTKMLTEYSGWLKR